jgi:hypothetical protein
MGKILATGVAAVALAAAGSANATFVLSNDNGGDGYLGVPDPGYDFLLVGADNGVGPNTTTYTTPRQWPRHWISSGPILHTTAAALIGILPDTS